MIALLSILTLAAAARVPLVNEVYTIPPDQWRYIELGLKRQPAEVLASYEAPATITVALALMRREDMENMRQGLPHGVVKFVGPGHTGTLRAAVEPGDYVLVLDNQTSGSRAASVDLRVWLDFSQPRSLTRLSPQRQLVVILVSLGVFFAILAFAGHKLWKAAGRPLPL